VSGAGDDIEEPDGPSADAPAKFDDDTRILGAGHDGLARLPHLDRKTPSEFAGYRIEAELGRGGMGVVYKARDPDLGRAVALKVLLSAEHASGDEIKRFLREASSAAKLRHSNIVPIHEMKVHQGKHYYTMDFIDGESLSELLKNKRIGLHHGLEILEKVAGAVDHAHSSGIIHRDLKPANIIIDDDGQPKVMDFGLAKVLNTGDEDITASGLTRTGTAIGTPYYESPEQAGGHSNKVDARSDVYSMGCILYQLITGSPPFTGATAMDVLRRQIEEDPTPPSRKGIKVSADIETICLKCLEKDPERRYQSAGELADDLRRYLEGEPVAARRASMLYVVRRKISRHSAVAAVVAAAIILISAFAIMHDYQMRIALTEAESERIAAGKVRGLLKRQKLRAVKALYCSNIALAHQQALRGNSGHADDLLKRCPQYLRNWEWGRVRREAHQELASLPAPKGLSAGSVSPDGERIAAVTDGVLVVLEVKTRRNTRLGPVIPKTWPRFAINGRTIVAITAPGRVSVWNTTKGQELTGLRCGQEPLSCLGFSGDGKLLAAAGPDCIVVWDFATRKEISRHAIDLGKTPALIFDHEGRRMAIISPTKVQLWDVRRQKEIARFESKPKRQPRATFDPSGKLMAVWTGGGEISVVSTRTGKPIASIKETCRYVSMLRFSPDGKTLAVGADDGTISIWESATGRRAWSLAGHTQSVAAIIYSADGKRLISGGEDKTVRVWDLKRGRTVRLLRGHRSIVAELRLSEDGRQLSTTELDGAMHIWDIASDRGCHVLEGHEKAPSLIAFTDNCKRLVSLGMERRVWGSRKGVEASPMKKLYGLSNLPTAAALSPDATRFAVCWPEGGVRLFDTKSCSQLGTLQIGPEPYRHMAFSRDGTRLVAADALGNLSVWNLATRTRLWTSSFPFLGEGKFKPSIRVTFSPDGTRIALLMGAFDTPGHVYVVAAKSGKKLLKLSNSDAILSPIVYSPDGSMLAWTERDKIVVCNSQSGKKRVTLTGHSGRTYALAFSPDGKRLVSASKDQTVKVWAHQEAIELLTLEGHTDRVMAVTFSPDGRLVASASYDRTIRIWLADDWKASQPRTASRKR
jgi:WD40 repeat protein/tRNA A-37 threonylcarbamoyl transferase component Bud32